MGYDKDQLPHEVLSFLAERHLATLATTRPDGSLHLCAIGFTYDPAVGLARVICAGGSRKAVNAARPGARAGVAQVDGPRWLSLEGPVTVTDDPERVADAVARYSARYRQPGESPTRVALEISVERILGRA